MAMGFGWPCGGTTAREVPEGGLSEAFGRGNVRCDRKSSETARATGRGHGSGPES